MKGKEKRRGSGERGFLCGADQAPSKKTYVDTTLDRVKWGHGDKGETGRKETAGMGATIKTAIEGNRGSSKREGEISEEDGGGGKKASEDLVQGRKKTRKKRETKVK